MDVAHQNASRSKAKQTRLVQSRISIAAKGLIERRCKPRGISEAAYIREVLYKELGLLPGPDSKENV